MDKPVIVVIIVVGIIIFGFCGFMSFMYVMMKKRGTRLSYRKKVKSVPIKRYLLMYSFYSSFWLTRNGITRLHKDIGDLSVFSFIETRIVAAKSFTNGLVLHGGLIILSVVLFENPIYLLVCLIFAAIVRENFLFKKLEKVRSSLLSEMLVMLSSLRQEYMRTRSVTEAFESCTRGKHIQRAVKEIYDSLMATDSAQRLEAFSASTPLPTLQTLASISHIVNNSGDGTTSHGLSMFASAIDMIADEVRMAQRKEQLAKQLFGSLEFMPVVPVIGIVPLANVFKSMIPGTSAIYDGQMGFLFTIVILGASLIGYYQICNATRSNVSKGDDRTNLDKRLMGIKSVRDFANNLVPKKRPTLIKQNKLLRTALTRNTLPYLYLRKFYMCVICFFVAIVMISAYTIIGRTSIAANVTGSSMIGGTALSEDELKILHTMDTKFLVYFKSKPSEEELVDFIKQEYPGIKTYNIDEQVSRLNKKFDDYNGLIFKWWMIWVAVVVGIVGWNLPEYFIKQRIKLIKVESEEDCLQLQTTIAIMMNTSTDTLDLLECLYKNSRLFKSILIDTYHGYIADPFLALRIAKAKTELPEFRNMMDKLSLTITQLTIAEAFSDLVNERDHMLRMRESAQLYALQQKRSMIKPFALAPMILLIALMFIAPICLLAYSMFADIMSSGLLEMG